MKRSELEKIIDDLGLEHSIENNEVVIMQVWQPYNNAGFPIDSKNYTASSLGKDEVQQLNSKFEKLLKVLDTNNIQIASTHTIENGIISTWILNVRQKPLENSERNLDFTIETKIKTRQRWLVNYNEALPKNIGYGYKNDRIDPMFGGEKFKKHELELIIKNIDQIFKAAKKDSAWIVEFGVSQNTIEPIKIAVEAGIITPQQAIEGVFLHDEIYYDRQKEYGTVLKYLTTLSASALSILSLNNRGSLPDLIIESSTLYNNVMKNWEFDRITGQKILTMLVQDEHFDQFVTFTNKKDPKQYQFLDWYDLTEQVLKLMCADSSDYLKKLLKAGWIDFKKFKMEEVQDFLQTEIMQITEDSYVVVMEEFIRIYPKKEADLLFAMLDGIAAEGMHESEHAKAIMRVFLKKTTLTDSKSFMVDGGSIVYYLDKKHPLYIKLMADSEFIKYLIDMNKTEFLPETIKDVFIF